MTARRRVLILDDEAKVAFFLRESLETLGHDLEVVSASSVDEALREIERQRFDLLVTDQRMPGMTGLELVGKVQERYPDTQFILITAYGSEDLFDEARSLGAYRYFTKPFHIDDFVQTVVDALDKNDGQPHRLFSEDQADMLSDRLEELRREVGAQCAFASTMEGTLIAQAGIPSGIELDEFLPLAAQDSLTSLAMSRYLGGTHTGNLTYYEGAHHDIYRANVEDEYFLVIVFDRRVQASRIGIVWLYLSRAIENMRRVRAAFPAHAG
jgi:CheY-like chemotaxis protein/predicted regulator of Ras-like GTPase activity (Roadblock/LC7/MglB family)